MGTEESKNAMVRAAVERVIDGMFSGQPAKKGYTAEGLDPKTFYETVWADPELDQLYARAQEARAELLVDEIIDIADTETDSQKARNRIDVRRWSASKMRPQKYGERLDVNVTQTVDISAALIEARRRALPTRDQSKVVDAEIVETKQIRHDASTDEGSVDPLS